MSESWKLKVLTGPYLGVVVDLPKGKFTLGSDDTKSDLVVADYGLSPTHLLFEVNEDQELHVVLLDKKSELRINSNIEKEDRLLIKDSSILTTEDINLAIVFSTTPWPEFMPTEEQQAKSNKSSAKATGANLAKPKRARHPLIKSLVITVIILLIVISPITVLLISDSLTDNTSILERDDSDRVGVSQDIKTIKRLVANAGYNDISATLSADASLVLLSGYVNTRIELQDILAITRKTAIKPVVKIKVMENIVQSVNSILKRNGFRGLEAYETEVPGAVVVKGYVNDYSQFSTLEMALDTKVMGLKSWSIEYVDSRKLLVIFRKMLARVGIEDVAYIEIDSKKLIVRSDLDERQRKLFYQEAEIFRRRYSFSPILEPYTKQMDDSELSIASVEIGRNAIVILKNGRIYMVGSKLPNGFTIKNINRKGITMIKDSKAMFYSFGGG